MPDTFGLWWRGLLIGFSIAAPVGPIGVLCVRRTLAQGRLAGLATGLGAATADGAYGIVAAFGLTLITNALVEQQLWLRLIGGVFLLYLGGRTLATPPAVQTAPTAAPSLVGSYLSTLFLTITNPMTIISFAMVFVGLGLASEARSYGAAAALVLGVFLGSALWWLVLSGVVGVLRSHFDSRSLRWVNVASGTIIAGFGGLALISLLAL